MAKVKCKREWIEFLLTKDFVVENSYEETFFVICHW
jgi:hypothetical protein